MLIELKMISQNNSLEYQASCFKPFDDLQFLTNLDPKLKYNNPPGNNDNKKIEDEFSY